MTKNLKTLHFSFVQKLLFFFQISLVLICNTFAQLADSPWPTFRHDIQHTSRSNYDGPTNPNKSWTLDIGSGYFTSCSIAPDSTIYIGSMDYNMYAINFDGSLKWSYSTGSYVRSSPAIGIDSTVYFGSDDNNLYALNPDGILKWNFLTNGKVMSSPVIGYDSTIYFASFDSNLYAIKPDGTLKWKYNIHSTAQSSPAIGYDGTIYIGSMDRNLYAINFDGSLKWKYGVSDPITFSPSIDSNNVIYFPLMNTVFAINPDGSLKWYFSTGWFVSHSIAICNDGTLVFSSSDQNIYAVNPDGTLKWNYDTNKYINRLNQAPVIGSDGTIYTSVYDSNLIAINPDGSLKWTLKLDYNNLNSPIVGFNNTLFLGAFEGDFYAIGEKPILPYMMTSSNKIDFGIIPLGNHSIRNVTFKNTGDTLLTINETHITSSDSSNFTILLGGGSQNLLPSDSATVTLLFSPQNWGTKNCNLIIRSNSPTSPDSIELIGFGGENSLGQSSWPAEYHDNQHTSRSLFVGPEQADLKWKLNIGLVNWGTDPVIDINNTIYIGSLNNKLYSIDVEGDIIWIYDAGDEIAFSAVIGSDGTIYVGSKNKKLHAINPDGTLKWIYSAGGVIASSPSIGDDGTIYIGTATGKFQAIFPDGFKRWEFDTGYGSFFSPVFDAQSNIYLPSGDLLYKLNSHGDLLWSYMCYPSAPPTIDTLRGVYICGGNYKVHALTLNGTLSWTYNSSIPSFSNPAIDLNGNIYLGMSTMLLSLDPNGNTNWYYNTGRTVHSSPSLDANGIIYFGSWDSTLYAIHPDGSLKWQYKINDIIDFSIPIIGNDSTIYFNSYNTLYSIGLQPKIHLPQKRYNFGIISIGNYSERTLKITNVGNKPLTINGLTLTGSNASEFSLISGHNTTSISPGDTLEIITRFTPQSEGSKLALLSIESDSYHSPDTLFLNGKGGNSGLANSAWPTFLHDYRHTGKCYIEGPDQPSIKWTFNDNSAFYNSPVLGVDSTIFIGSWDNKFYAINKNGTLKWSFTTNSKIITSAVVSADCTIIVGSSSHLYAFDYYGRINAIQVLHQ